MIDLLFGFGIVSESLVGTFSEIRFFELDLDPIIIANFRFDLPQTFDISWIFLSISWWAKWTGSQISWPTACSNLNKYSWVTVRSTMLYSIILHAVKKGMNYELRWLIIWCFEFLLYEIWNLKGINGFSEFKRVKKYNPQIHHVTLNFHVSRHVARYIWLI